MNTRNRHIIFLLLRITIALLLLYGIGVLYFRVVQNPSISPTPSQAYNGCIISGCSNEICGDTALYSICSFKAEYECYRTARCEKQKNGHCGWTQTAELVQCLKIKK